MFILLCAIECRPGHTPIPVMYPTGPRMLSTFVVGCLQRRSCEGHCIICGFTLCSLLRQKLLRGCLSREYSSHVADRSFSFFCSRPSPSLRPCMKVKQGIMLLSDGPDLRSVAGRMCQRTQSSCLFRKKQRLLVRRANYESLDSMQPVT